MKKAANFPKSVKIESKPAKFCPGCGYNLFLHQLGRVINDLGIQNEAVMMTDIGCNLLAWNYFNFPTCQTHHGRTISTASGFKMVAPQKRVISLVGDGGGYAIGLQNLIHSCLRDIPITVILANNIDYSMTGGQISPTSIEGQITDSTPFGKSTKAQGKTLLGPELLRQVAHTRAYLARTSTSKPQEIVSFFKEALERQKEGHFSFVEVISACPLNWQTNGQETLDKLKKLEAIFPQGEIK